MFLQGVRVELHGAQSLPVYHVVKPRTFISPLTLYGHVTGLFYGKVKGFF